MKRATSILLLGTLYWMASVTYVRAEEAAEAASSDHFGGSLTFATDYVSRGVSQTGGEPALQGSVEYARDLGATTSLYGGLWASNVDFNDGGEATLETDWTAGVRHSFGNWSFDTGLIYYYYPGASSDLHYNFWELQGKAVYDFKVASLAASVNYSPDNFGNSGRAFYPKLALSVPLKHGFSVGASVGRQTVSDNAAYALPDYTDWGLNIGYRHEDWSFSLSYTDTSISHASCPDNCGGRVLLSVTKTF